VEASERLKAANDGTLGGILMCFAGGNQVRFCEAKVGPDRIKATQRLQALPAPRSNEAAQIVDAGHGEPRGEG
jgi:hypothetical protein